MRMVNVKAIETFVLGIVGGIISAKIYHEVKLTKRAKDKKQNCKSEDRN